jgi:hypothetical protein
MNPAAMVFLTGDSDPLVINGTATEIADTVMTALKQSLPFVTLASYEPEGRSSRSMYVNPTAVACVIPALPGDRRRHLETLEEYYE